MATGRPGYTNSRVAQMLAAVGRTKNDLIRATGIEVDTLDLILSGQRDPRIDETAYLAAAFRVPPRVINPALTPEQL